MTGSSPRVFALDVRALALFRMAIGAVLCWDLFQRLLHVEPFLTDVGVMPRWKLEGTAWAPGMWSLHMLWGDAGPQIALLSLAGLAAIAMIAGLQTRLATVVSWVLLVSLHYRHAFINNTGDDLLRILLLWACFLPLGAVWSLDARRAAEAPPRDVQTPATGIYVLQMLMVYWFVALNRLGQPEWFSRGNAVYLALSAKGHATELGWWFRNTFPWALAPMTWAAMFVEGFGPFLAISPWRHAALRTVAVFGFIGLHLAFDLLLEVGIFPFVSASGWLALLPGAFFDRLGERLEALRAEVGPPSSAFNALAASAALTIFLGHVAVNVQQALPGSLHFPLPERAYTALRAVGAKKHWEVYSPPPHADSWPVIVGHREGGGDVDLWRGTDPIEYERPERSAEAFRNQRWRRVMYWLAQPQTVFYRRHVCNWLAREWEREHPGERIESADITVFVLWHGRGREGEVDRQELGNFPIRR